MLPDHAPARRLDFAARAPRLAPGVLGDPALKRAPVVVIGAGCQGLTFALAAARRGRRVIVLESSGVTGGMARSFSDRGFTFDLGLHAFVSRDERLQGLVREVLGRDFDSLAPRGASWLGPGDIIEDERLAAQGLDYPFYVDAGRSRKEKQVWNCMRVYCRPPAIVYPKRGGAGRILEALREELVRAGGRILLNSRVSPGDLAIKRGLIHAIRIGGSALPVEGCYWAAEARSAAPSNMLAVHHFFLKGKAPLPHHWVRIGLSSPFLPAIVYYPSNLSAANAPEGCHSVGAVVPLPLALSALRGAKRRLIEWQAQAPSDFQPWILRFLSRAGLLSERRLLFARQDVIPLPPDRFSRRRLTRRPASPGPRARNLWRADDWLEEVAGESWMAIMMRSALRAADELLDPAVPCA